MEWMRARERGFTLIEVVVAVGIIATTTAAGIGLSLASRSFGVAAAATEFDHLLDSARTISHQVQGATIAFIPDAYGDGTEVRVYAGTANGTPVATTLPPLYTHATIEEVESIGKPPFAFVLHVNGALGGRSGYRIGANTASSEIGCPAKGAFHFVIHVNGGSADRFIPCRTPLAATGPATLTIWPAATMAPLPTPCAASCTPAALPTAPSSSPSCPPNFTAIPGGCTPTPTPSAGARYHVSVSVASPTMNIGGTDSFTAEATLTNPASVPIGTPASVPVTIQQATGVTCTASPQGSQPSGTTFTLNGISAGTCTVVMQADVSSVPGATTDAATVSVSVSVAASPAPTPTPPTCDLVANGKCYSRIVNRTAYQFSKFVIPNESCSGDPPICYYLDSIYDIALGDPYTLQPATLPTDSNHELLFQIDAIQNISTACLPYSAFATIPADDVHWGATAIGGPADPPRGYGEPSKYVTINRVSFGPTGGNPTEPLVWPEQTTALEMYEAVATRQIGDVQSFSYSSANISSTDLIGWFPDFPGCDVAGGVAGPGNQYGIVKVELVFEIFQAAP